MHVIRVNPRVTRYPKIRSDHLDKTCLPWPWPGIFDNQLSWQLIAKYFKQLNTINHVYGMHGDKPIPKKIGAKDMEMDRSKR